MTGADEARRVAMIAEGLEEGEKSRLLDGRLDWRASDWQDHCGDPNCEQCEGAWIPWGEPNRLSDADKALRAHLKGD